MNFPRLTSVLQSGLPCAQRMIMTVLINHAGDGTTAYPSHASIAKQTGLAERSVWGHLKELESAGWIGKAGSVGRVTIWEVVNPVNSATYPAAVAASIPQKLRDDEKPIPQILPDDPAKIAGNPANSATLSRKSCELTTHEPLNNHKVTTQSEGAGGPPPAVVKVKTSKPDWRDWNRGNAEKANAVQLPDDASDDFRTAWKRWCDYRTAKAVDARISSEAVEWTVTAAESGIRDCQRAAKTFGWPEVLGRMDQAQAGGWRGFNFDRMTPPRAGGFSGQHKPRHAAYDASTATAGMTSDQILKF
jgi:Helix-turn-helix domain